MANFTGLSAGRQAVLTRAGWDLDGDGLTGAPRVTVLVGADRHASVDVALRYLGLGASDPGGGRRAGPHPSGRPGRGAGRRSTGRSIVALQAGNLHSGAFDPFAECIDLAHEHGAWVHVDGAFGLWAAAAPTLRNLVSGVERADSWATDAHKTLNTPYDCGIAHRARLGRAAGGVRHPGQLPAQPGRAG